MKAFLKRLMHLSPVPLTKNMRYDRQTEKVIRRVCRPDTVCVDVGAHTGEILDLMRAAAPKAVHYAFEPIPALFEGLKQKYPANDVLLSSVALSDRSGLTAFNYVTSNPAYSGLLRRNYDRPSEQDTTIVVATDMMDAVVPPSTKVGLIKIDVEGAEMLVLRGAAGTIRNGQPVVIFEHGLGASDVYGATPEDVFGYFEDLGYRIFTLDAWLRDRPALEAKAFRDQFYGRVNHYFLAAPARKVTW